VLDRGIVGAYHRAGLTADPCTWSRPAPVLADLVAALQDEVDPKAGEMAARLAPYTTGTWRGLFDGPTTTRPDSHLIVFSLRDLPEELKTVGTQVRPGCVDAPSVDSPAPTEHTM
jgi:hypothetical protein